MLTPPAWFITFANLVRQIFGLVTGIQQAQMQQATQAETDLILSDINAVSNLLTSGTDGLTAIKNAVDDLATLVGTNDTAIMATLATLQASGVPVTLPSLLPSTWAPQFGDFVWGYIDIVTTKSVLQMLENAGSASEQRGFINVVDRTPFADAMWTVSGDWGQGGVSDPATNSTFPLDVSTILASDATSADWLNRVYPTTPWQTFNEDGTLSLADSGSANWNWNVDLPIDKWLMLKAALGLSSKAVTPPIWPGLAGVTLGTPVAIDTGVTITTPMDGVLIDITAAPLKQGFFTFDTAISYRNIGALAFFSDNGNEEFPQTLGFTSAVYCPKTMEHAAGVVFRASADLTGTITPFIVN